MDLTKIAKEHLVPAAISAGVGAAVAAIAPVGTLLRVSVVNAAGVSALFALGATLTLKALKHWKLLEACVEKQDCCCAKKESKVNYARWAVSMLGGTVAALAVTGIAMAAGIISTAALPKALVYIALAAAVTNATKWIMKNYFNEAPKMAEVKPA